MERNRSVISIPHQSIITQKKRIFIFVKNYSFGQNFFNRVPEDVQQYALKITIIADLGKPDQFFAKETWNYKL